VNRNPYYWLVSAQRLKKVKQREAYGERLVELAFMTAAYTLVFNDIFGHGWLGRHFLRQEFGETFNDHVRRTGMLLPSLGGHE
jgi:hypothetical protein